MTDTAMRRLSATGDALADAVAMRIDRRRPSRMMDEVHYLAKTEIGVYQELIDHLWSIPDWVDWQLIDRAQKLQNVFNHARTLAILTGSLIEGYCQNRASVALVTSGHLNQEVVRRVYETNQLIHSTTQAGCLQPGASGHRALAEIRLSNALMRKSLVTRDWYGRHKSPPLSQLDMAYDILEFSHIAKIGMQRLGIEFDAHDQQAIHHFWRYCGHLYGLDEDLLTNTLEQESQLHQSLSQRQETVDKAHQLLAKNTLQCIASHGLVKLPADLILACSRLCLSPARADELGLPQNRGWRRTTHFYRTANRSATFLHYRIPGMSLVNSRLNRYVSQNIVLPRPPLEHKPPFKK